jgi:hypothetical protein
LMHHGISSQVPYGTKGKVGLFCSLVGLFCL